MSTEKQIIAMGGGGFTMEPGNPLLDDYILSQTREENPKICFLPTASGDDWGYIGEFYDFFTNRHCIPSHLALSRASIADIKKIEEALLECDIIYVGGGHTGQMLSIWRKNHIDAILRKAWEMGIILAGVSAGASCWFEYALTDSIPGQLSPEKGLGFLPGSHCAHYDSASRRPTFHQMIGDGFLKPGIGTENFAALHFKNLNLEKVVCSRSESAAYKVHAELGTVHEEKFNSIFLGTNESND